MKFIGPDTAFYDYWLRYLCTDEAPTPNELSKIYVVRSPKNPMCDSDIDSSHQRPSNMMSNSPKRLTPSVRIRLLMTIRFAIYVLTKPLHLTNYRKFNSLETLKPPCVIVISIPLIESHRI